MAIFDHIQHFGNSVAVLCADDKQFSYTKLASDADRLTAAIPEHSLVILIASNCYASIAAYVGCMRKSVVPLMLPSGTSKQDFAEILHRFAPAFIFADQTLASEAGFEAPVEILANYGLYKTNCEAANILNKDLALLLTTSGSTGSKSFVRLSAKNVKSNAAQIIEYLGVSDADRAITTMPMSYSYGLSIINSHLVAGASIVLTEETLISPKFWALIKEQKVTNFGGVPFIYEMLKKLRFGQMDLPHLRYITQAGGKLSDDLVSYFSDACREKGADFWIMYGQTEATARMTYVPPGTLRRKAKSVGTPVPGGQVWLIDEQGERILEQGRSGELIFQGPNVSLGYANSSSDLISGDENEGILHTGDIAEIDSEGYIYIIGRKKRFLKLYGNRVNLAEVEELLEKHGFSAACIGTDDKLVICIEGSGEPASAKALLKSETTLPPKGYSVVSIDEFPRSENGKVSYHLLNAQIGAG